MAALGKRQREGDLLTGRCPGEEPQFQTHHAEGIPHPDVSHMESEGLAPCLGPPPYAGRVGWVPAAHLSHSRGKASLLQEDTAKPSQQLSQESTSSSLRRPWHSVTLRHLRIGARTAESQKRTIKIVRVEQNEGKK